MNYAQSVHYDKRNPAKNVRSSVLNASTAIFNVGGKTFPILKALNWSKLPIKRLQKLNSSATVFEVLKHCDYYDTSKQEIFFDRDSECFNCILESCLKRGKIHLKKSICPQRMLDEMEYWEIGEDYLDNCCRERLKECKQYMRDIGELVENYKLKFKDGPIFRRFCLFFGCEGCAGF